MAVQQSSSLVIEELSGDKRVLELVGSGLPFQGATWTSALRVITKWYPGNNAEATQQVLGPIELPSDWEGKWSTTRLIATPCRFRQQGTDQLVTRASSLRTAADLLFSSGQRLRVTWGAGSTSDARWIVREGRAVEWAFPHDRMDDIA